MVPACHLLTWCVSSTEFLAVRLPRTLGINSPHMQSFRDLLALAGCDHPAEGLAPAVIGVLAWGLLVASPSGLGSW